MCMYVCTHPPHVPTCICTLFSLCPQVFDNYAVTVMIGGEPYTLGLFDTAGKRASLSPFPLSLSVQCAAFYCVNTLYVLYLRYKLNMWIEREIERGR